MKEMDESLTEVQLCEDEIFMGLRLMMRLNKCLHNGFQMLYLNRTAVRAEEMMRSHLSFKCFWWLGPVSEHKTTEQTNHCVASGVGIFFKVGSTSARQKNYEKLLWFELATVTSQALKYDAINFCQDA